MATKKTHPQNATSPGRKPLKPGEQTVAVPIRMTTSQRDKLARLGGPTWVRSRIDKAREPDPPED